MIALQLKMNKIALYANIFITAFAFIAPFQSTLNERAYDTYGELFCSHRTANDIYILIKAYLPDVRISADGIYYRQFTMFDPFDVEIICIDEGAGGSDTISAYVAIGTDADFRFLVVSKGIEEARRDEEYFPFTNVDGWSQSSQVFFVRKDKTAILRTAKRGVGIEGTNHAGFFCSDRQEHI
jgi:hypothetical protein